MNDTKVKKKWTKKKKILVIVFSILAFLLVAILCAGLGVWHWYCSVPEYQIKSAESIANADTELVAHRGFDSVAPENTLPAFEQAGKAGYKGVECDIYRTKDGVWVLQHDLNIARMMNGIKSIEHSTYNELLKYNVDNGTNIGNYENLKICTLDEYLQVCDKYNMTAFIELKGNRDTDHYDEIVNTVNKHTCKVKYLSFYKNNLIEMRKLTDAQELYLCNKIDEDSINTAKSIDNCGLSFNTAKNENFENDGAAIKTAQSEGLALSAWTVDDLATAKKLIAYNINSITTNAITY